MNLKPEELVNALRFCGKHECITCPCDIDECSQMVYSAADQIERDQNEIAALKAKVEQYRALIPSWVIPMTPKEDTP